MHQAPQIDQCMGIRNAWQRTHSLWRLQRHSWDTLEMLGRSQHINILTCLLFVEQSWRQNPSELWNGSLSYKCSYSFGKTLTVPLLGSVVEVATCRLHLLQYKGPLHTNMPISLSLSLSHCTKDQLQFGDHLCSAASAWEVLFSYGLVWFSIVHTTIGRFVIVYLDVIHWYETGDNKLATISLKLEHI